MPHIENIPGLLDYVAGGSRYIKPSTTFGVRRVAQVHPLPAEPMQAEARPHQGKTAKLLAAGEAIAAVDALCLSGGEQNRNIVALLSVFCGEDRTCGGLVQPSIK